MSDETAAPIAIRAARWVDIDAGEVRPDAVVVVEGDRISRICAAVLATDPSTTCTWEEP